MTVQPSGELSGIEGVGQGLFGIYSLVEQASDLTINAISLADTASQRDLGFTEVPDIISDAVYNLQQAYEAQVEARRQIGAFLLAIGFSAVESDPPGACSMPGESDGRPADSSEFFRELQDKVSDAVANAPVVAINDSGTQTVATDEQAKYVRSRIDPADLDTKIWIVSSGSLAPNVVEISNPQHYRRLVEMAMGVCAPTWESEPTIDQLQDDIDEINEHEIAHWQQAGKVPGLRRSLGVEFTKSESGRLAFTPYNRVWGVCTKGQFLDIHNAPEHPSHSDRAVAGEQNKT